MATKVSLTIDQGSLAEINFNVVDPTDDSVFDLTGHTVSSHIRKRYSSDTFFTPTVAITDAVNGLIYWSVPSALAATLAKGTYVFDILATIAGEDKRVVEGVIVVTPSVTRNA